MEIVALGFMLAVLVYLVLQPILLLRLSGGWRTAAAIPLGSMVPVLGYTVFAFAHGSNIFPLVLIFTSPFALFYLLALLVVRRLRLGPA